MSFNEIDGSLPEAERAYLAFENEVMEPDVPGEVVAAALVQHISDVHPDNVGEFLVHLGASNHLMIDQKIAALQSVSSLSSDIHPDAVRLASSIALSDGINDSPETMKALLNLGADPNGYQGNAMSMSRLPLIALAEADYSEADFKTMKTMLIEAGANIHDKRLLGVLGGKTLEEYYHEKQKEHRASEAFSPICHNAEAKRTGLKIGEQGYDQERVQACIKEHAHAEEIKMEALEAAQHGLSGLDLTERYQILSEASGQAWTYDPTRGAATLNVRTVNDMMEIGKALTNAGLHSSSGVPDGRSGYKLLIPDTALMEATKETLINAGHAVHDRLSGTESKAAASVHPIQRPSI